MSSKVRTAVFPVAGMGTRFLPATKANPKEMLPIVDKPLIQFAAEEAVAAGINKLVFITGRNKRSIPDHFDKAYELEHALEGRGKTEMLQAVQDILPSDVTCVYIRQPEALGLGHAVLCAKPVVDNEPFAVILADDLIDDPTHGCLGQMTRLYDQVGCSILGVEEVDRAETGKYGIVRSNRDCAELQRTDSATMERLSCVEGIVEKPKPEEAPSTLAVVGRYILTPAIFDKIEQTGRGAGGEIQLTDAIAALLADERVLAYRYCGQRYDCGSKLGYLKASVEYGLNHSDVGEEFRAYLRDLASRF